jgi:DNA excision repair protein ERCC-3
MQTLPTEKGRVTMEQKNMSEENKMGSLDQITQDRVKFLIEQLVNVVPTLKELTGISDEARKAVEKQIADFALSIKTSKLDVTQLENFFKKPYYLEPVPRRSDSWYLIIPKFIDVRFGWLEPSSANEAYNKFLLNRYMDWLGEIPQAIKKQLNWKAPPELTLDGEELHGSKEALNYAWQKFRPLLRDRDETRIKVNSKRAFELIASLVKDGILPFSIKPIDPTDLTERKIDFELREYQKDAWEDLKKYSAIGVFYPPSTGKTVIGLWVMTHLKPKHLVVVPTRLLQEQWIERIQTHTDLKPEEYSVMTYQAAITKAVNEVWTTKIIDEVHHLPANTFVKLALIKAKYTIGLSASPFREDGREEYVFALSGKPVGLSWEYFKELNIIKSPTCHVWIVKNFDAKMKRLESLLEEDRRTIIFSDSIQVGDTIKSKFKIPFVNGTTADNMETILANRTVVVSRVGDEGMSLPDIERVIEVSWLGGSRRQELQRTTRLLHSQTDQQENHVLMTLEEYLRDRKRLFAIMDKGFKIVLHREGVSEKVIEQHEQNGYIPPRPKATKKSENGKQEQTPSVPIMSGQSATYINLPGVQKIINLMSKKEKQLYTLLLDHDGEWFSREKLPFILGYASKDSMRVSLDFGKMVGRGWIEQTRIDGSLSYRTNMRGKMGGS